MNIPSFGMARSVVAKVFLSIWLSMAATTASGTQTPGEIDLTALDERMQDFSSRFHTRLAQIDKPDKVDSVKSLMRVVNNRRAAGEPTRAIATVIRNLPVAERQIHAIETSRLVELLLAANLQKTAVSLYEKMKSHADKTTVSVASLAFAKHYFARRQWEQTVKVAESIGNELATEDYHHARLLHGIALQRLRRHRAALTQYQKIAKNSRYYTAARINMAMANIRQDWWTDAHIIIEDVIRAQGARDPALTDRLYTTLGYSLLRQQYYRNAREAFGNVGLNGPYTSRALLGIALSAAHQQDYVGALNAIQRLKDSNARDLSVDEAHLLIAYFYEKLEQPDTATAGYSHAIRFYEQRIADIEVAMAAEAAQLRERVAEHGAASVPIGGEVLNLEEKLPAAFIDELRLLLSYNADIRRIGDGGLTRTYTGLVDDYTNVLHRVARDALAENISHLNHYMSQARYGMVAIQDQNSVKQ